MANRPFIRIIQSKQNAQVKALRSALQHPGRNADGLVAIEGFHLLEEALRSAWQVVTVFVAAGHEALLDKLNFAGSVEVLSVPEEILNSAVTTEAPQPVAALVRPAPSMWKEILNVPALILILAGLQDPGNLGTILRSAEAFGASGVILLPGTVSPWNAKAMRASAGSVFRIPMLAASWDECVARLKEAAIKILATLPNPETAFTTESLAQPVALLIGNEGSGLTANLIAACDGSISIPCSGAVESLNAAVAASILLYEASQQRTKQDLNKQKKVE